MKSLVPIRDPQLLALDGEVVHTAGLQDLAGGHGHSQAVGPGVKERLLLRQLVQHLGLKQPHRHIAAPPGVHLLHLPGGRIELDPYGPGIGCGEGELPAVAAGAEHPAAGLAQGARRRFHPGQIQAAGHPHAHAHYSGPILEAPFQCRAHVLHLGPAIASGGDTHQLHLRQEFPGQCRAHRAVAPGVDGRAIWNTDAVFYSPSLDFLPTQLLDQGWGDLVVYHHQALSHSSRTSMPSIRTSKGTEVERTMGSSKVAAS